MKARLLILLASAAFATSAAAQSRPFGTSVASDLTVGRVPAGAPAPRVLALHQQYLDRVKQGGIDVVFFGDSITNKWRDVPDLWNSRYEPIKAVNFGINGIGIEHVLWRVEHGELDGITPKVVVLMIGTNNTNRKDPMSIVRGIRHLIDVIHGKQPAAKVLLMAILPRDRPNEADRSRVIDAVNPELSKLDNGATVRVLDIHGQFLSADGTLKAELFTDRLHLTPAGYQIWADAMQPLLDEMLKP